jgi:hypothetical protein
MATTRLGLSGTPRSPYGSFAAKSQDFSLQIVAVENPDTSSINVLEGEDVTIAAIETSDTSNINISEVAIEVTIAATEAPDSSNITVLEGEDVTISATESSDSSVINILASESITIAATETSDSSSINILEGEDVTISATENSDSSSVTILEGEDVTIAAIETSDTSAINISDQGTITITATEPSDICNIVTCPIPTVVTDFKLLEDRVLYKKITNSREDGQWLKGVYYPSNEPTNVVYKPFSGEYEPLSTGQARRVLPEGINTTDAIIIYSDEELFLETNNSGNFITGDSVYLENPDTNPLAIEYVVFNKETWDHEDQFELLLVDSYDYVCIRRELL